MPVQSIVIKFPFKHLDVSWVSGGLSQLEIVWRLLCQFHNNLEVEYLPVYTPDEHENGGDFASSKLFATNVREYMANHMNVPTTEHSYEDVRLAGLAQSLHLPASDALIEIGVAKKFLGDVTMDTIEKHLNVFAAMDTGHTGHVNFEQVGGQERGRSEGREERGDDRILPQHNN